MVRRYLERDKVRPPRIEGHVLSCNERQTLGAIIRLFQLRHGLVVGQGRAL